MAITLYHVDWCPECAVVREKLAALGLSYESVLVPDFRPFRKQVFEISGQYYVPVLKDGEAVLTETREILGHLEERYGNGVEPGSEPADEGESCPLKPKD